MKITVICDVFGDINNGTILATVNLIEYLKKKGHTVTIVSSDANTTNKENYYVVPALNLGKPLNKILEKNGVNPARVNKEILMKSIQDADVVHIQMPLLLGRGAVKIAKSLNKPLTASFHCQAENVTSHFGLMNCKAANHFMYQSFYKNVYQYCCCIHYPTQFIRDVFEKETKKTNGTVISNGVNEIFLTPTMPKQEHEKFVIVCSGRYSHEKAQWQLIKAVAASKHKDECKIVLAGDGPDKKKLRRLAHKLKVDCQMQFFSRQEMVDLLRNADLYVHTAIIEIEAIACMEAIACGLVPIICNSDRSATRYFALDCKCLYKPKDIDDLSSKIDFWFDHPEEREEAEEEYQQMGKSFALESCMEKMEDMLQSASRQ